MRWALYHILPTPSLADQRPAEASITYYSGPREASEIGSHVSFRR